MWTPKLNGVFQAHRKRPQKQEAHAESHTESHKPNAKHTQEILATWYRKDTRPAQRYTHQSVPRCMFPHSHSAAGCAPTCYRHDFQSFSSPSLLNVATKFLLRQTKTETRQAWPKDGTGTRAWLTTRKETAKNDPIIRQAATATCEYFDHLMTTTLASWKPSPLGGNSHHRQPPTTRHGSVHFVEGFTRVTSLELPPAAPHAPSS